MSEPKETWWELVTYFRPEEGKEYVCEGQQVFLCGDIGDMPVAQIAEVYGNEMATMARIKAAQEVLRVLGCEKGLVVTDSVKFVKLREVVDEATLAQLRESKQMAVH